ncbi:MAG: hypothetical protein ABI321_23655, partial [Polyangia bacterium]
MIASASRFGRVLSPATVVAATAVVHAPSLFRPLSDYDEAVYATVASMMNRGGVLYADGGVDMKAHDMAENGPSTLAIECLNEIKRRGFGYL